MDHLEFYEAVYSKDNSSERPHGWIQWKGTDVCMDVYCECGHHGHVDSDFFYYYECSACHKKYAVGQTIKLIPLTQKQIEYVESGQTVGFKMEN
jgi:hypothetical protein